MYVHPLYRGKQTVINNRFVVFKHEVIRHKKQSRQNNFILFFFLKEKEYHFLYLCFKKKSQKRRERWKESISSSYGWNKVVVFLPTAVEMTWHEAHFVLPGKNILPYNGSLFRQETLQNYNLAQSRNLFLHMCWWMYLWMKSNREKKY